MNLESILQSEKNWPLIPLPPQSRHHGRWPWLRRPSRSSSSTSADEDDEGTDSDASNKVMFGSPHPQLGPGDEMKFWPIWYPRLHRIRGSHEPQSSPGLAEEERPNQPFS